MPPAGRPQTPQPEVFGAGLPTAQPFSTASTAALFPPDPAGRMLQLQLWRSSSAQSLLLQQQASLLSPREYQAAMKYHPHSASSGGLGLGLTASASCCSILPASIPSPREAPQWPHLVQQGGGRLSHSSSAIDLRRAAEGPSANAGTLRRTNGDGRGREWRMGLGLRDDIQGALRVGLTMHHATPIRGDGMVAIPDASQHDNLMNTWVNSHSHSTLAHSRSFT